MTFDRVAVRKDEAAEQVTAGGLIVPGEHARKSRVGEVVAVGPGKEWPDGTVRPMSLRPGQRVVLLSRYEGVEWRAPDGTTLTILPEDQVIAVEEP